MRVRTLGNAFFCGFVFALGNVGLTLWEKHASLLLALVGIAALWAAAITVALALCRAAAAGDRLTAGGRRRDGARREPRRTAAPRNRRASARLNIHPVVSRNGFLIALALTMFSVMAPPAGARVARRAKRGATIRRGASSCPGAELQATEQDLARIRAATLCLVNRERVNRGESPLQPDAHLEQAAQAHTESMAFKNYFEHDGPNGDTPLSRMRAAGYIYSSQLAFEVGENIGWGTLEDGTPRAIVAAWMASPGHRANILDARFRDTAVGVSPHPPYSLARGQAGAVYTQDFGTRW